MESEIDTTLLPKILREMSDLVGISATMAIVRKYGGVRLYVPKTLAPDHQLIKLIGFENAQALVDKFGGDEHIEIPFAEAAIRKIRDGEIKKEWRNSSQRQLALKYNMTERHIRRIVSGCKQDNNQLDLF